MANGGNGLPFDPESTSLVPMPRPAGGMLPSPLQPPFGMVGKGPGGEASAPEDGAIDPAALGLMWGILRGNPHHVSKHSQDLKDEFAHQKFVPLISAWQEAHDNYFWGGTGNEAAHHEAAFHKASVDLLHELFKHYGLGQ